MSFTSMCMTASEHYMVTLSSFDHTDGFKQTTQTGPIVQTLWLLRVGFDSDKVRMD